MRDIYIKFVRHILNFFDFPKKNYKFFKKNLMEKRLYFLMLAHIMVKQFIYLVNI